MVGQCPICLVRPSKPGHICATCRGSLNGMSVTDAIAKAERDRAMAKAKTGEPARVDESPKEREVRDAIAAVEQAAATGAETHGLGDKIAVVAKAFGFEQTPDCGCKRRQANLNHLNFKQSPLQVAKDLWNALRVKKAT